MAVPVAQLGGLDISLNKAGEVSKTGGLLDTTSKRFNANEDEHLLA